METRVIIVGDGPTGLSAAVLLAKNGFDVDVVGNDRTPVHKAALNNFLAAHDTPGPEFIGEAREHAERYGAKLHVARVEHVEAAGERRFRVVTEAETFEGDYLVLATGFGDAPAGELGLAQGESGVQVDINGRTSRDGVYAGGSLTRGAKSQVATSVGDGAAIAVDILSREKGEPTHDWDVLKAAPSAPKRPA